MAQCLSMTHLVTRTKTLALGQNLNFPELPMHRSAASPAFVSSTPSCGHLVEDTAEFAKLVSTATSTLQTSFECFWIASVPLLLNPLHFNP